MADLPDLSDLPKKVRGMVQPCSTQLPVGLSCFPAGKSCGPVMKSVADQGPVTTHTKRAISVQLVEARISQKMHPNGSIASCIKTDMKQSICAREVRCFMLYVSGLYVNCAISWFLVGP